jgi:hypothetical protein
MESKHYRIKKDREFIDAEVSLDSYYYTVTLVLIVLKPRGVSTFGAISSARVGFSQYFDEGYEINYTELTTNQQSQVEEFTTQPLHQ